MNENAKKWVAALRSGEFKQGYGTLGGPWNGYCCLGVACVVFERETGKKLPKRSNRKYATNQLIGPMDDVRRWIGLSTPYGVFAEEAGIPSDTLAAINDSEKFGFNEIADIIESEPDGLFVEGSHDQQNN